ncbi:hypothetical protein J4434_04545 [Candidatus Woesearchaeota archaeon]|nr:hypothetical protein [Candidatus Woesearchaeota archaeon]
MVAQTIPTDGSTDEQANGFRQLHQLQSAHNLNNSVKEHLFPWLVYMHYQNLMDCMPFIADGSLRDRKGLPIKEGREADVYSGVLILANGTTLIDRLQLDGVVEDKILGAFTPLSSRRDFMDYIKRKQEDSSDGAYVVDSHRERMVYVSEFNSRIPINISDYVPQDFFYYESGLPEETNIGLKTKVAIRLPLRYDNVDTYQIKRSAYTKLGLGKVTHFNMQGLAEEFFFKVEPNCDGPFVVPEQPIVGVYRTYERKDGALICTEERRIDPRTEYDAKSVFVPSQKPHVPLELIRN